MKFAFTFWTSVLTFTFAAVFFASSASLASSTPQALSLSSEDIDVSSEASTPEPPSRDFGTHDLDAGIDITYVPISYPNYIWYGGGTSNHVGSGVHLAAEWLPVTRYGKLGVGGGFAYYMLRNIPINNGGHASLNTFPLEAYLSYRLDYVRNQLFVPFVKAGTNVTIMGQTGGPANGSDNYYGFDYSGGMELCLNALDKHSARGMARSIGIYNTFVVFEYLKSQDLMARKGPDLRHQEFRLGLRFEM